MMYRGKIPCGSPNQTPEDKMVTMKLWVKEGNDNCDPENQKRRLEDFNPILTDFGMLSGGVFAGRPNLRGRRILYGASGYKDFQYAACGRDLPGKRDVYAYGVLLLNLIAKRVSTEELADKPKLVNWAIRELAQAGVCSVVHQSLQLETTYGWKLGYGISLLAVRCVHREQHRRPTISEAVKFLEDIVADSSRSRERQLELN